jgi:hypothetical protein
MQGLYEKAERDPQVIEMVSVMVREVDAKLRDDRKVEDVVFTFRSLANEVKPGL